MDNWIEKRKGKISASNAAAILGLKPFGKMPIDAWQQIMGIIPYQKPTKAQKMGQMVEAVIAELYADDVEEETGVRPVYAPKKEPEEPLVHPSLPWLCGTPDRLIVGQNKGVEIKNVGEHMLHGWGKPGTDEIPDYYLTQVIIYMAITGYDEWDVVASMAGGYPEVFPIRRNKNVELDIIKQLEDWYVSHIVSGVPPEPDASDAYAEYLKRLYRRNEKPLKDADPAIESAMANLAEARRDHSQAEERKTLYENIIKAYIGDAEGVRGSIGAITWKKAEDSIMVDWESLAKELMEKYVDTRRMKKIQEYTKPVPGSRRFLPKFNKKL